MMACEKCVYGTGEHTETCANMWVLIDRNLRRWASERAEQEYRDRVDAAEPKPESFLKY